MQYRKKPVVVDAFKWLTDKAPDWWTDHEAITMNVQTGSAYIPTAQGIMVAEKGDWIIQGVDGSVYPIKEVIFLKTYEKIDE